jgi:hypothetical protein
LAAENPPLERRESRPPLFVFYKEHVTMKIVLVNKAFK